MVTSVPQPIDVNSLCETPDEAKCSIYSPEKDSKIDDESELENIIIIIIHCSHHLSSHWLKVNSGKQRNLQIIH